jgi:hypothetical protein
MFVFKAMDLRGAELLAKRLGRGYERFTSVDSPYRREDLIPDAGGLYFVVESFS